ncbi:Uncharacterized membrane protein [Rhizobium sp. RU20A]|uniref:DUF1254 domain-containing protein n=1 Tax=Rhizobium sp. RU20A TaxID=1907412 RepID=UPI000955A6C8|nr:DUF1254 domain-containing protein [Rhizobium sp. RU20A]SIR16240.1 Uncharacterized membrane protein [Rhizobium sp. RU20A]
MRSFVYALAVGLLGAAILHIVIILMLPRFSERDAFSRVSALDDVHSFVALPGTPGGPNGLANDNPYLRTAVCTFSIGAQPALFQAVGAVPFWSIVLYDEASNEIFSMNDKTSVAGNLDLVVATPAQMLALRRTTRPELEKSILVEMSGNVGYAVLRTLAPMPSLEDAARNFLAEATCDGLRPGS